MRVMRSWKSRSEKRKGGRDLGGLGGGRGQRAAGGKRRWIREGEGKMGVGIGVNKEQEERGGE